MKNSTEKNFTFTNHYRPEAIRAVQLRLIEMARTIARVIESIKAPYFISFGTLLGAYRLQGFFPWDDDFDFSIADERYDEVIDALRCQLPSDLIVHDSTNDRAYFHSWARVKDLNSRVVYDIQQSNIDNYLSLYPCVSIDLYRLIRLPSNSPTDYILDEYSAFCERKLRAGIIDEQGASIILQDANKRIASMHKGQKRNGPHYFHIVKMKEPLSSSEIFPTKRLNFEGTDFPVPRYPEVFLRTVYDDYEGNLPLEKRRPHFKKAVLL